jgi:hypothetical protein
MRFVLYTALLVSLVVPVARATPPLHPGQAQRASLWTKLCAERQILKTRTIPAAATPQNINVSVNGHLLRGWIEGQRIAGLGGHGVIAQITFMRKAGPAVVRLASVRVVCVRVHVVIVWR